MSLARDTAKACACALYSSTCMTQHTKFSSSQEHERQNNAACSSLLKASSQCISLSQPVPESSAPNAPLRLSCCAGFVSSKFSSVGSSSPSSRSFSMLIGGLRRRSLSVFLVGFTYRAQVQFTELPDGQVCFVMSLSVMAILLLKSTTKSPFPF